MGKTVKKGDLPQKTCVTCGRPFTWRKKWERVWDEVGWEQHLLLTVNAGESVDPDTPGWVRAWSRWRVEMLDYFGDEVPDDLRERAELPKKPVAAEPAEEP